MSRSRHDPKIETLRKSGCLHARFQDVTDEAFTENAFFDPRDLLQVKYEMLRRVRVDKQPVSQVAHTFGLSRPSYYQAQALYEEHGLAGLLPEKPGPRHAHKLSASVVDFLDTTLQEYPELNSKQLAQKVRERFALSVHPRSIERALLRKKKKR